MDWPNFFILTTYSFTSVTLPGEQGGILLAQLNYSRLWLFTVLGKLCFNME